MLVAFVTNKFTMTKSYNFSEAEKGFHNLGLFVSCM